MDIKGIEESIVHSGMSAGSRIIRAGISGGGRITRVGIPDIDHMIEEITVIYNYYVQNTTSTFDVEPLSMEEMREHMAHIAAEFPFFIYEEQGKNEEQGRVKGYCYAHPWKTKPAYSKTLETTIYLSPDSRNRGIGTALMTALIDESRRRGYVGLIACITAENQESCRFHERLGFLQVSLFKKVGYKFGRYLDVADYELLL